MILQIFYAAIPKNVSFLPAQKEAQEGAGGRWGETCCSTDLFGNQEISSDKRKELSVTLQKAFFLYWELDVYGAFIPQQPTDSSILQPAHCNLQVALISIWKERKKKNWQAKIFWNQNGEEGLILTCISFHSLSNPCHSYGIYAETQKIVCKNIFFNSTGRAVGFDILSLRTICFQMNFVPP